MSNNIRMTSGKGWKMQRDKLRHTATECALCGKPLDWSIKTPHPMSVEIDHIIPVSRGGAMNMRMLYGDDNCQAVHRCCNRKKSNKLPHEMVKHKQITNTTSTRGNE